MKNTFLAVIVLFAAATAFGQKRYERYNDNNNYNAYGNTPAKVQRGWESYHPSNTTPTWSQDGKYWHAHYTDRNTNRDVDEYYNKRGKMMDAHREWDKRDLPSGFNNRIWDRYHTKTYTTARIDRPGSGSLFKINLDLGVGGLKVIYMDEQGNEVRYRDRH